MMSKQLPLDDQTIKTEQPIFSLIPIEELMKNPQPIPWLIKGFFPACSVGQVFGDPGTGKSLLALWVSACIATGKQWDGINVSNQGDVIYLAGEGRYGLPQRMLSLSIHHHIDLSKMHFSQLPAALNVREEAENVTKAIDAIGSDNISLIVIDTMHRHMSGDENSSRDVGDMLRIMDGFKIKYDCAILIIHHSGHNNKDRSRGSSSLKGAWDYEYALTNDSDIVELKCVKAKDFQKPLPRFYKIKPVSLPWLDNDGVKLSGVTLERIDDIKKSSNKKLTRSQERTLSLIHKCLSSDDKQLPPSEVFKANEKSLKAGQFVLSKRAISDKAIRTSAVSDSDKPDTQRKAVQRATGVLRDKGFIELYEDWLWLSDISDKAGQ